MSLDSELLARIDERTTNIDEKLSDHMETLKNHIKEDSEQWKRIDGINIRIATWTGAGAAFGVVIGFIVRLIFK